MDKKFIIDNIKAMGIKYDTRTVFEDFISCCAYSLANASNYSQNREDEYLRIVKKYSKADLDTFAKMFASLQLELQKEDSEDLLGQIYEEFGFSSKDKGQFFTPLHIGKMMSKLNFDKEEFKKNISEKGYINIYDPCCGSGRLLISYIDLLKNNDINLDDVLFVGADLSNFCACMTYVNLSLLGANAVVYHQNTLTLKTYDFYISPSLACNEKLKNYLVRDGYFAKEKQINDKDLEEIEM